MSTASPTPPRPSERKFGLTFAVIFLLLAGWLSGRGTAAVWPLGLGLSAMLFAALAWRAPRALAPLNEAWFRLGLLLGRIVSPIVMGVIFFGLITPLAIGMRLAGRDALGLKPIKRASHWVERQPPGPSSDSFRNQF